MARAIGEEIRSRLFGGDVSRAADIGATIGRETLHITAGRRNTVKINLRLVGNQISDSVSANAEAVDLLEDSGAVGSEGLPALLACGAWRDAIGLPSAAIGLP